MAHEQVCPPGCIRLGVMYDFMSQVIWVEGGVLMEPCSDSGGLADTV